MGSSACAAINNSLRFADRFLPGPLSSAAMQLSRAKTVLHGQSGRLLAGLLARRPRVYLRPTVCCSNNQGRWSSSAVSGPGSTGPESRAPVRDGTGPLGLSGPGQGPVRLLDNGLYELRMTWNDAAPGEAGNATTAEGTAGEEASRLLEGATSSGWGTRKPEPVCDEATRITS